MEGVTINIVSDTLTPALARLEKNLHAAPAVMRTIANILDRSVKENFRAEGRPEGWRALQPSTANAKVTKRGNRRGYAHILRVSAGSAGLLGSIQTRSSVLSAEIGTPKKYAGAHQYGTNVAGRGRHTTIPKRTFIGRSDRPQKGKFELLPEDEQSIVKAIDAHVIGGQTGA